MLNIYKILTASAVVGTLAQNSSINETNALMDEANTSVADANLSFNEANKSMDYAEDDYDNYTKPPHTAPYRDDSAADKASELGDGYKFLIGAGITVGLVVFGCFARCCKTSDQSMRDEREQRDIKQDRRGTIFG